ncbi:MAG: radical SAM protein [Ignisphaera sp.]
MKKVRDADTLNIVSIGNRMRIAKFWRNIDNNVAECYTCERRCRIDYGRKGICGNYVNVNGKLYNIGYGKISALESRPIEIKPLFHYWPNSTSLTFSFWGCNFYCPWCQNHHISFRHPKEDDEYLPPHSIIALAIENSDEGLCASFNEPTVSIEYVLDLAELARDYGLYFSIVTNGYQTIRVIEEALEAGIDGWSIDIKGCPKMKKALVNIDHWIIYRNAKYIIDRGGHVEIVYLVVTNTNDLDECIEWIIDTHLSTVGPKTPLHINRYYPAYKWYEPPTSLDKLISIALRAKREGIEFVYLGNTEDPTFETTYCPKCGKKLVYRWMYRVKEFNMYRDGNVYRCPRCNYEIPIKGKYISWKKSLIL